MTDRAPGTGTGTQPGDRTVAAPSGRPPGLHRGLRILGTLLITLSGISPASSVFIIAPGAMRQAGTGTFWSFAVAAVVGVCMAFVYAELASAYPLSGGEYAITARTLGRLPGFTVLGLMLVTQLLITAVIALGVGSYLSALVPGLPGPATAAVTCAAAAVFAVFDIKLNAWVTGAFLAVELLALLVLSGLGLLHTARPFTELLTRPVVADGSGLAPASVGLIAVATAVAVFAYNGYGSAVYFGEELQNAPRSIARVILWALGVTVVAELLPITAVLLGAPDLHALFTAGNPISYVITQRGGGALNTALSLGVALAIINAVLAIVLMGSRMLYSTARDGTWPRPVNRALSAVHPRFGSPWVAALTSGGTGAVLCFADEQLLLVVTGTAIVVVYGVLCVAALAGRRNGATAHAAYRMPLYPAAPLLVLAALACVVWQDVLDPHTGRPSLLVTAGLVVASVLYYLAVLRRSGRWTLHDPETSGGASHTGTG